MRLEVAVSIALAAGSACEVNPGPQVDTPVPAFELADLEGKTHSLGDLRGQVVVLNFWATWCPPCVDEMPSLEKLHKALGARGLAIVAVSVDERFDDIEEFVDRYGLSFLVLHDNGKKVSRRYQTFKYPETYIIDRNGRLKSKVVGPRDWASPTVIRDMVDLLSDVSSDSEEALTEG
ncbi:MAG TPA: TlpA disulfide reductase family protein [Vicinamibacteria bacterium]|nr:TlpA disulfide reductase family protein [Vicinamibacteria bacterium]